MTASQFQVKIVKRFMSTKEYNDFCDKYDSVKQARGKSRFMYNSKPLTEKEITCLNLFFDREIDNIFTKEKEYGYKSGDVARDAGKALIKITLAILDGKHGKVMYRKMKDIIDFL